MKLGAGNKKKRSLLGRAGRYIQHKTRKWMYRVKLCFRRMLEEELKTKVKIIDSLISFS